MREDVHGQLVAQMGHLMKKSLDLRGGTRESAAEHRAIMVALDSGDPERAARLLEEHIEVPMRVLRSSASLEIFESNQDGDHP